MNGKLLVFLLALPALCSAAGEISLSCDLAVMTLDASGRIVSLTERGSGRELLAKPTPFVGMGETATGRYTGSNFCEKNGELLRFRFPENGGEVTLKAGTFAGGFTFTVADVSAPKAKALYIGRVAPAPRKWFGRRANMASDEKSGLCVRAYDLFSENQGNAVLLQIRIPADRATGAKIGIVGAPRARLAAALQTMTIDSGRPRSTAGGAWAAGSEAARGSYLNADVTAASLDDWIDLAERGGFDVIHFRESWYACRGHYPVNTNDWPNGLADMKKAVEKIHAAGYRAGLHTLTACIDPKDPWVAGPENSQLITTAVYTLAENLAAGDTELTIAEAPKTHHDTVFTYSGNGNALLIGGEIVQYSGFTKTPPYRFTGLKRGAFGTRAAAHAKGSEAGYLQQRYIAFYPQPDSPLADGVADAIANVYNTCGFDQIYCDGAEGMRSAYGTAAMRDKIIARCTAGGRSCLNEDSVGCPSHSWWFHSRVGAWDSCYWAPKRFHDFHIERVKRDNVRLADLLEVQMGWWAPILSSAYFPAHKLDDMEYYASRNAGLDASMSISGVNISRRSLRFHTSRMMTVLGWYERARRARAFLPDVQKAFDRQGAEFRLRQNGANGRWEIAPVKTASFRAVSRESERLTVQCGEAPVKCALRVEALYAGERPDKADAAVLTEGVSPSSLERRTANAEITVCAGESRDGDGRRTFRLTAENRDGNRRGAWASASAKFDEYRKIGKRHVMRFRVKGDGSGALLNVQIENPPEYGKAFSEHYVTLDFTGWRDFEMPLRERDAARFADYAWPYRGYGEVFHRLTKTDCISAVNFYLNEIPAGGKTEIEVSDLEFVAQRQLKTKRHAVKINSTVVPVPFEMYSGWFAELEDGIWTLYSADGEALRRVRASTPLPALPAGESMLVYRGETADGTRPRAEVTLFTVGKSENALRPTVSLPENARRFLSYEAVMPQFFAPGKGFGEIAPITVRPGETASLETIVYGPMPDCTLTIGGTATRLPAVEKGKHRKFKLEGLYRGVCPVVITPEASGLPAEARFEFAKRYR